MASREDASCYREGTSPTECHTEGTSPTECLTEGTSVIENISGVTDPSVTSNLDIDSIMESLSCRTCPKHPTENIVFFCEKHVVDCCVTCVTDSHGQCSPVFMEDIFRELFSFLEKAKFLRQSINGEKGHHQSYFRRLKTHFILGEKQIQKFYNELRRKVDEAENTTMSKLQEIKETKLSEISGNIEDYDGLKKQMENILKDGERLYKSIVSQSDKIPCVESNELMKSNNMEIIKEKLNVLTKIVKDTQITDMNFVTKNQQVISKIESSLFNIITITDVESPKSLVSNETMAHTTTVSETTKSPVKYLSYGQISCDGRVHSMYIIPNTGGEMFVVTSYPHRLVHIDIDGTNIKSVNLPDIPCDVCMYGDNVAVTIPDEKQLISYKTSDFTINKTINVSDRCHGVCRVSDMFIISFRDEGIIRCINDNGQIIKSSHKLFSFPSFVRFSEHVNCILISNTGANEVMALNVDLTTVLFKMSHTDLQLPAGLCINECGDVYVCSCLKHCVVEFTKEGKYKSTILSADQHGITEPLSICYNDGNRCLYVATWSNVIRTYKGQ